MGERGERGRETEILCVSVCVTDRMSVCVCVCLYEREKKTERKR